MMRKHFRLKHGHLDRDIFRDFIVYIQSRSTGERHTERHTHIERETEREVLMIFTSDVCVYTYMILWLSKL